MSGALMESTSSEEIHQTKLVPTAECYGLEVLETVNTSVARATREDAPPEDPWPNFNAVVAKL